MSPHACSSHRGLRSATLIEGRLLTLPGSVSDCGLLSGQSQQCPTVDPGLQRRCESAEVEVTTLHIGLARLKEKNDLMKMVLQNGTRATLLRVAAPLLLQYHPLLCKGRRKCK